MLNHKIIKLGLEEDINQRQPFINQSAKLVVNVMYTSAWVISNLRVQLKQYGITLKQFNILKILKRAESPLTTSEIRERMIENMSDVTRLIDRLITKGYAKRKKRNTDKRLVDITISQNGLELLNRIASQLHLHDFVNTLEDHEAKQLNFLLDKLRNQ